MQKCKKCFGRFTWGSIFKSILFDYKPIFCKNCNSKHYVKFITKLIINSLRIAPVLILKPSNNDTFMTFQLDNLIIFLAWVTLLHCIAPFFVRYHFDRNIEG